MEKMMEVVTRDLGIFNLYKYHASFTKWQDHCNKSFEFGGEFKFCTLKLINISAKKGLKSYEIQLVYYDNSCIKIYHIFFIIKGSALLIL